MKLLVTGASGLIGGAVARAAWQSGIQVIACGRRAPTGLPNGVECVASDVSNLASAMALIDSASPTHIIHAAWETRQPSYWNDPTNLDWVIATAGMAGMFAQRGGARFVQIGSCAEYDWDDVHPLRDGPTTRYGKAKLAAFKAVETAAHERFAAVEARVFWVYGPGENPERYIPMVCRAHAAGDIPKLGSGRQRRDLVHIDDAARALLMLLGDDAPTGVIDLGTGIGTPLADVATEVALWAGARETGLGLIPDRPNDPDELIADSRALRSTGWQPHIALHEGIAKTFEHWRTLGNCA